jgi:hypothetical protein
MLTRRLNSLVEAGLLRRELYCEHPPRHEYRLTARGKDFRPVLLALLAWGNRHFLPQGEGVMLVDVASGSPIDPLLVDRHTGRPLEPGSYALASDAASRPALPPVRETSTRRRRAPTVKTAPTKSAT